jgi:hypothetical protein
MNCERRRRRESGYLMEIPLLLAAVGALLVIVLPMVPAFVGKVLIIIAALIGLAGLYYMFSVPGWLPGQGAHACGFLGKVAAMAAALAIVAMAILYVWVN